MYFRDSSGCEPYTTIETQNNFPYQQQRIEYFGCNYYFHSYYCSLALEYNDADSKKIRITCQPRSKFRPRTQNESKNSAHYIRCENGTKPEYPTISVYH